MTVQPLPRTIHPYPNKMAWGNGLLFIGKNATLHLPADQLNCLAPWMTALWNKFTHGQSKLHVIGDAETLCFTISDALAPAINIASDESYVLHVDQNGVNAVANDVQGFRYAWLTLMQMLQLHDISRENTVFAIPHAVIHDQPAMPFRGLHLCVFPETTMSFLTMVVHLAGMLKYSHIVLEFWGTLKLETLKELAWPTAYTKEQVEPLLTIARDYGMEVIPMYNAWGHAASSRHKWGRHVVLDQNPMLSPLFEPDGWTWCLSNPASRAIIGDVIDELCDWIGDGTYFHIGCDEAYSHALCDHCRTKDRVKLLVDHINCLSENLECKGRRVLMWGDTLLEHAIWSNDGFVANGHSDLPTHEALDKLSRNIVIADWHYSIHKGDVPTIGHFMQHGFDVVTSPWHEYTNIIALVGAAQKQQAFGMLATTWNRLPQSMPMLVASASAAWSKNLAALDLQQAKWNLMAGALAHLTRTLTPSGGVYADAGWQNAEYLMDE